MPRLMFACPSIGLKFASGIHTDARGLASVGQMPDRAWSHSKETGA
jgi:hypothetical protein